MTSELFDFVRGKLPDAVALGLFNVESGVILESQGLDPQALKPVVARFTHAMHERFDPNDPIVRVLLGDDTRVVGRVREMMISTPTHLAIGLTLSPASKPTQDSDVGLVLVVDSPTNLGLAWIIARDLRVRMETELDNYMEVKDEDS